MVVISSTSPAPGGIASSRRSLAHRRKKTVDYVRTLAAALRHNLGSDTEFCFVPFNRGCVNTRVRVRLHMRTPARARARSCLRARVPEGVHLLFRVELTSTARSRA
eukprot:6173171-Pleurochrysis_carterae.AAC.1